MVGAIGAAALSPLGDMAQVQAVAALHLMCAVVALGPRTLVVCRAMQPVSEAQSQGGGLWPGDVTQVCL